MNSSLLVHQFTAFYADRDAVGQHTRAVELLLRDMGHQVSTFGERQAITRNIQVHDYRNHHRHPEPDIIIYQISTGSIVADYLLDLTQPLILNYHNITPAPLFFPWEPHIGASLALARQQLARLCCRASAAIADSHFNAAELNSLGLKHVSVVPILSSQPSVPAVSACSELVPSADPLLLFVGRIVPNKRIETLIAAVAILRRLWPDIKLALIGTSPIPSYIKALHSFICELDLQDSITFLGSVSDNLRDNYYSKATVYLSASVHEGFCVPLIESMSAGLPIVAHAAAAVPETAGNAAMLVYSEEPMTFACAVARVLQNNSLRDHMVHSGLKRSVLFSTTRVEQHMRRTLQSCIASIL